MYGKYVFNNPIDTMTYSYIVHNNAMLHYYYFAISCSRVRSVRLVERKKHTTLATIKCDLFR